MTYKALVDAGGREETKNIVLANAAACIFRPQSTGYTRTSGAGSPSAKSVVELLTKPFTPDDE